MYNMSVRSFGILIALLICIRECSAAELSFNCPSGNVSTVSTIVLTCTIKPAMTWKSDEDFLANCDTFSCAVKSLSDRYKFTTDHGGQTVNMIITHVEPEDDNKTFKCVTSTSGTSCKLRVSSTTMASTTASTTASTVASTTASRMASTTASSMASTTASTTASTMASTTASRMASTTASRMASTTASTMASTTASTTGPPVPTGAYTTNRSEGALDDQPAYTDLNYGSGTNGKTSTHNGIGIVHFVPIAVIIWQFTGACTTNRVECGLGGKYGFEFGLGQ